MEQAHRPTIPAVDAGKHAARLDDASDLFKKLILELNSSSAGPGFSRSFIFYDRFSGS
jgi:hypothetical protein